MHKTTREDWLRLKTEQQGIEDWGSDQRRWEERSRRREEDE